MKPSFPPSLSPVALVGFGLMGGSLARDLKSLADPPEVVAASDDPEDLEAGLAAGVLDGASHDPGKVLPGAGLVVYATPLSATLTLLSEHKGIWDPGTVVTDVASLKKPVLGAMVALGEARRYVGSHPLAGGEGSGFGASRPGIFRGARVWLVSQDAAPDVRVSVREFWESLGGEVASIGALEHDRAMTWVSHLPQLCANALALALERAGILPGSLGPGGRDMTRLAESAPAMWNDLLRHAPPDLPVALAELQTALDEVRNAVVEGRWREVEELMETTRAWKRGEPWN